MSDKEDQDRAKDCIEQSLIHMENNEWKKAHKWARQALGYLE